MKANYIAKKSMWTAFTFWSVLFFWLLVPLVVIICRIIDTAKYSLEFYDDKVVEKSGILNKEEKNITLLGVYSIEIKQSLWGRIFNYGDLKIHIIGQCDLEATNIAKPKKVKDYLESKLVNKDNSITAVAN